MDNYAILEKHRKKLSVYFALFILLSLWITQGIFLIVSYTGSNLFLQERFRQKLTGVENVLKNKAEYSEKIANNDTTLEKLVEKSLENVSITQAGNLILGDLDDINLLKNINRIESGDYTYFKTNTTINDENYQIIIKIFNPANFNRLLTDYLNFIGTTLIFSVLFYYLGYFFVGRNLRPIRETIASLESFSANINHEMKTPLAEIISTLSLAQATKDNYEQAINQSLQSSQRLDKILDSMLGIINLVKSSYSREKVDLISQIKNIISEKQNLLLEKNITINTDFKNKNFSQKINKQYFDIVVGNVLSNAIKYSNENGVINITFENGELEIEDFGVGIDEKNLKNIFSRFFREDYNKEKGLGIGLSLVKKIADLYSWKISIESQKGIGTKVKISFL
ncbi:MAG: HAMP domain-containing histidine kinase [Candidatus Gracilibacteria bacterium]|nr:HAMP domain-containing histidine kinase [Candidatus Gracilibacteria bacterium]